jgi:hypothetical protein
MKFLGTFKKKNNNSEERRLSHPRRTEKADSHKACRAHAALTPFPCHAVPLPCSDSAVSFVKVRVVAGNIRTASPTV